MDRKILELLARDGRMTYTDLGKETGLSTSAAQQRVRRLEQRGIITGYRAMIDPEALGKRLTAFISVRPLNPDDEAPLPSIVSEMAQIVSCYSVAGDSSYVLKAQVADPAELDRLLSTIRVSARASTITTVVLNTFFNDRSPIVDDFAHTV